MNLFHRKPCPAHAKAVEAVFAQNLTAQVRAGEAAAGVTRSSDQTRHHLERLREEIAQRTDRERFSRPQPHTSDVRSLVDTVLARVQPRPDQKG